MIYYIEYIIKMCWFNDIEVERLKFIKKLSLKEFKVEDFDIFENYQNEIIELPMEYNLKIVNHESKSNISLDLLAMEYLSLKFKVFDLSDKIIEELNSKYNITYYQWRFLKRYFDVVMDESEYLVVKSFVIHNDVKDEYKIKTLLFDRFINKKFKKLINLYKY